MTGNFISKGLREGGRVAPGHFGKVFNEAARLQEKVEGERKRIRRKIGITTQQPKMLDPVKPDPLPTPVEVGPLKKVKPKGRQANILASRMNRRRQILNTRPGVSILR